MQCPYCGSQVPENARFCKVCGSPLTASQRVSYPKPPQSGLNRPESYRQDTDFATEAYPENGYNQNNSQGIPYNPNNSQGIPSHQQQFNQQAYSQNPGSGPGGFGNPNSFGSQNNYGPSGAGYPGGPLQTGKSGNKPGKKKTVWIVTGICAALLVVAGIIGTIFFLNGSSKEGEIEYRDINRDYVVLEEIEGLKEPFSKDGTGNIYTKSELVTITELAEREGSDAIYGQAGSDWLLIEEGDQHNLRPEGDQMALTDPDNQNDKPVSSQQVAPPAQSEKPQEEPVPSKPEDLDTIDEPTVLNETVLDIKGTVRQGANYSGPACTQIVLNFFGQSVSQSSLASDMLVDQLGLADYQKLTDTLNSYLKGVRYHGNSITYYPVYDEDLNYPTSTIISRLKKTVYDDQCPAIVTICDEDLTGSPKSVYAVVYGCRMYSDGTCSFYIYAPTEHETPYMIDQDRLIKAMRDCGFICYLY